MSGPARAPSPSGWPVRATRCSRWRPAARQDWVAALATFDEYDRAQAERRDMRYVNEIGTPARADDLDTLVGAARGCGLQLENWYGVRIAVDPAELDPPPPADPASNFGVVWVSAAAGGASATATGFGLGGRTGLAAWAPGPICSGAAESAAAGVAALVPGVVLSAGVSAGVSAGGAA